MRNEWVRCEKGAWGEEISPIIIFIMKKMRVKMLKVKVKTVKKSESDKTLKSNARNEWARCEKGAWGDEVSPNIIFITTLKIWIAKWLLWFYVYAGFWGIWKKRGIRTLGWDLIKVTADCIQSNPVFRRKYCVVQMVCNGSHQVLLSKLLQINNCTLTKATQIVTLKKSKICSFCNFLCKNSEFAWWSQAQGWFVLTQWHRWQWFTISE